MALITCKECGREVSSKADKCPHCGIKVKSGTSYIAVLCIVCAISLVLVVDNMFNKSSNSKTNNSSAPSTGGIEVITTARAVGCPTINAYEEYLTIAQEDNGSATLQVAADLNCRMMLKGDKVKVLEWNMLKNLVKVHPEGNSMTFWLASEFVSTNEGNNQKQTLQDVGGPSLEYFDPFVVNLDDPKGNRYLKVKIVLEFESSLRADSSRLKSMYRDKVISTITKLKFNDVLTSKGKTKMRDDLLDQAIKLFSDYRVNNLYFEEFVVQ